LVLHGRARSLPAWNQQDIEGLATRGGRIGKNAHSAPAADRQVLLGNKQQLEGVRLGFARHLEDFPRAHKVELLDILEQKNSDFHGLSPAILKRARNAPGLTLSARLKARRMRSSEPNP